jgi:hypothetical protein
MPFFSYEARKFSTPLAGPTSGRLSLSLAGLIWGAITVGMTPISMGGTPRPLIELCWRAALATASLEQDSSSGRWVRTAGYRRLDASEKRAVSYFLGMTQAKITCERLLGAPHLIHLDAYLAMIGQATRASRPDLVGVSLPSMDCTIAVEAKGRTGGRTEKVIGSAKKQASSLPGVLATSSAIRVASVASFDPRGRWEAYLEDPPGPFQPLTSLTAGSLLAAYYQPLVAALLAVAEDQRTEHDAMTMAPLPGIDVILGIPTAIVTIMRQLPLVGLVAAGQLQEVGGSLLDTVRNRLPASQHVTAEPDDEGIAAPAPGLRPYTGLDGVYVGLGSTWPQAGR